MASWELEWRDRRIERLEKRVDAIEQARREEKWQAAARRFKLLDGLIWIECAAVWAATIALLVMR